MNKIVYLLGAGFSRPLGLPVMSNFLDMARDLYYSDTKKYSHFSKVLDSIRGRLAFIAWYYETNLDNIEEILSILEMEHLVGEVKETTLNEYKQFIIDVIQYYTPPVIPVPLTPGDKGEYVRIPGQEKLGQLLSNENQNRYVDFVLTLFNSKLDVKVVKDIVSIYCSELEQPQCEYSVITLNYDLVLENYAKLISDISTGKELRFNRSPFETKDNSPKLVKLHGSVDNKQIVIMPTWNKSINSDVEKEWECAYQLLGAANQIRVIGYSLPETDAYVKYLFKSSLLKNGNLKKIDILCKDDDDGSVRKKYREFIKLSSPKFRFTDSRVENYLDGALGLTKKVFFEHFHNSFMEPPNRTVTHIG